MDIGSVIKTYDRYSSVYDLIFGIFFFPGRKKVIKNMELKEGDHVLEVGIGTGASLKLYPQYVDITGIDLSEKMLNISNKRVEKYKKNAKLHLMNAEELDFPDNTFSHVVAMYVVSVAPNPKMVMDELERVCKPGGEIIILNHFSDEKTITGKIEKFLSPLSVKIGFKPFFPLKNFIDSMSEVNFDEIEKTNLFGYWSILRGRKV